MKRISKGCLALILLWTLVPGVGEFTENFVHLVVQGHTAHAEPDGDTHAPDGREHGCTGSLHLCSCCVSLSCLPGQRVAQAPDQPLHRLAAQHQLRLLSGDPEGVDRPPRA
jgi:hypothetical protein